MELYDLYSCVKLKKFVLIYVHAGAVDILNSVAVVTAPLSASAEYRQSLATTLFYKVAMKEKITITLRA